MGSMLLGADSLWPIFKCFAFVRKWAIKERLHWQIWAWEGPKNTLRKTGRFFKLVNEKPPFHHMEVVYYICHFLIFKLISNVLFMYPPKGLYTKSKLNGTRNYVFNASKSVRLLSLWVQGLPCSFAKFFSKAFVTCQIPLHSKYV